MKTVLILCIVIFIGGCASAKFNPKTGEFSYSRFGDQKVSGFSAAYDPNTGQFEVKLDAQESAGDIGVNLAASLERMFNLGLKAGAGMP